ncbi:tyrosine-type recombinase/integrase [Chloroflexota bacterium]
MDIKDIFERYEMDFRARGYSEKTIIHNEASVRYFIGYLGNAKGISEISGDDFRRFLGALRGRNAWEGLSLEKERKLSGTTINTYSRAIKSFWKWLKQEGIIAKNPLESVPNPKNPKTIPKVYSEDEVRAIFRLLPEGSRERAIIDIILDSGIRLSELVSLELANINLETGRILVHGKGGKERYTYIESSAIKAISDYVNKSRPKPVCQDKLFLSRDGYPLRGNRIQKILAAIGKEAGLSERLAPHKLRHTCATLLLKYGDNLEHIRMIFGHSDIKTTSKSYLNVADHDVAAAHRKSSPLENILRKQSENTELDRDTHPPDLHGKPSTTKSETELIRALQELPDDKDHATRQTPDEKKAAPIPNQDQMLRAITEMHQAAVVLVNLQKELQKTDKERTASFYVTILDDINKSRQRFDRAADRLHQEMLLAGPEVKNAMSDFNNFLSSQIPADGSSTGPAMTAEDFSAELEQRTEQLISELKNKFG